ncbi:MAG: phosphatase PAP2 family protein [Syntrophomonadaceae bacterium]|jgi:membrane-associated phospholipid phosphatase|nr:phosphatase PAP2 family protein [Syntrophomonadaceae bacterium]
MITKNLITVILIFINLTAISAQSQDTTKIKKQYRLSGLILPTALITCGAGARIIKPIREFDYKIRNYVKLNVTKNYPIDNYMQYAPAIAVFGLDLVGIEAKNNFRDRALVSATSYLLMTAVVRTMKYTIDVQRPNSFDNHSFPSGHTATVFVGAHILYKEYKDTSPWIAIAGYTVATGTGLLRIYNNHHWLSDTVTGAGIGILSAEAGYLLLPAFHKMLGVKEKDNRFVIIPSINTNYYGISLAYSF